jgi:hypothetical protein
MHAESDRLRYSVLIVGHAVTKPQQAVRISTATDYQNEVAQYSCQACFWTGSVYNVLIVLIDSRGGT